MEKIRTLIVDDSVVFRSQIRMCLEKAEFLDVVGVASNGHIALEKLRHERVDLMILDLEMPVLDGLGTLQEMRRLNLSCKVIVFSSLSPRGAKNTLEALDLGAVDFVAKPNGTYIQSFQSKSSDILTDLLLPKIRDLFDRDLEGCNDGSKTESSNFNWLRFEPKMIFIGCSTGGPMALEKIFSGLRAPFDCPILIVQHMPPVFTANLAGRISKICGVPAAEGRHDEIIEANRIYIAPGNFHMRMEKVGVAMKIKLNQEDCENSVRPSVDPLFRSAAKYFDGNALGVILTGMGKDGLQGSQQLRARGNPIIIQNRESCVVFGMPGALYQCGAYDSIQNLEQITETLNRYLHRRPVTKLGAA